MTGADIEIFPGVVIDNNDEMNQCRVKAVVPTVFDNDTMTAEEMMWIRPACMFGQQTFSKLNVGSKIWVLHDKNNYFDYSYIPQFELTDDAQTYVNTDSDVAISRSIDGDKIAQYYNRNEGFMTAIGNNKIQLTPAGNLDIISNEFGIKATASEDIKIGKSEGDYEPAILGNKLHDLLSHLSSGIQNLANIANTNPYTVVLVPMLSDIVMTLTKDMESIKSQNVKLN